MRQIGIVLILFCLLILGVAYFFRDSFVYKRTTVMYSPWESGVVFYDRWRADDSSYLILNWYAEVPPTCIIMDYGGKEIYRFPDGFCRFTSKGELYISATGVTKFSSNGDLEWQTPEYHQHHGVDYSEFTDEFFFVNLDYIAQEDSSDSIVGIDHSGKQIFHWIAKDHYLELEKILKHPLYKMRKDTLDAEIESTHFNSVQVIPPNRNEPRIPAFRRGNILVNCFNQSIMFIIDRSTGKIIWSHVLTNDYGDHFNGAHTSQVLDNGNLFYLWNKRIEDYRNFTSVIEYDPYENKIAWEYTDDSKFRFFIDRWGAAYPVGANQTIISNTPDGIVFQVDRSGRIVWEWHASAVSSVLTRLPYQVIPVSRTLVDRVVEAWKNRLLVN